MNPVKVITYSTSRDSKIDLTPAQVDMVAASGISLRSGVGDSYCNVSNGEHFGLPTYTDAELAAKIADQAK